MAPFDRPYATFYWSAIVNIALSCTIYELFDVDYDDYEDGDVMISIIMNFDAQNTKFPKKYILSETSKWHKKEITNDKHKINNMWKLSNIPKTR